jgi:hypothetical protein
MDERVGEFRVYRIVPSVPHLNLQAIDEPQLYTVYQSGYDDLQPAVDALRTGDRVAATVEGDPATADEPWRLTALDQVGDIEMGFAVDIDPPDVARETWTAGAARPACTVLKEDGEPVGACCVQPRDPLPEGAFVPNVLTGLLPIEAQLRAVPELDEPATEALFLDPDPPDATRHSHPYGVLLLFTDRAESLPDRFRERYDCPRGADTRPDFDPYGV